MNKGGIMLLYGIFGMWLCFVITNIIGEPAESVPSHTKIPVVILVLLSMIIALAGTYIMFF